MVKGIDISYCQQGKIDWDKLDVDFIIARAGYGKTSKQKDNTFEINYTKAKLKGIPIGAYWYSYAKTPEEAKLEAKACIEVLKGKQLEYPVYYDVEENSQYALGKNTVSAMIEAFCSEMEAAGYFVGFYTNLSWYNNVISENVKKRYALWIAHWNVSAPGANGGLWQYKVGKCNGIDGDCDLDYGYVNYPEIIKQKGLNGFAKQTEDKHEELFNNNSSISVEIKIDGKTYSGELKQK